MNGRKFIGASVLTMALMLGAAGTANATDPGSLCVAELVPLNVATDGLASPGDIKKWRDIDGLQFKLEQVDVKIGAEKFEGADDKLENYKDKVAGLLAGNSGPPKNKVKIDPDVAETLTTLVNAALLCVGGLI